MGQTWGEPWLCHSVSELQQRMDVLARWQRELYPAIAGMSRQQAYPGLKHSGRTYDVAREAAVWDLRGVWDLMAAHLVPRDVSSQGKVSLYNRPYSVGLRWAGRTIWVGFDAEAGTWTFQDEAGHEIRRQVAPELSAERIQMLEVTNRRRGVHAPKPRAPTTPAEPTGS